MSTAAPVRPSSAEPEVDPAGPRAGRPPRIPPGRLARLDVGALLPAALVLFFAFQAGGFFPVSTGVAACALAIGLTLRVTLGARPFAGFGPAGTVVAAALAAFAALTLASAAWSDAPGRALTEFNRALLYLFAFLLASSLPPSPRRLGLSVRLAAAAILVVCLVAWGSRVLPGLIEADPGSVPERLSHPLTYWNAQGLIATLGLLLGVHLACSVREPRWVKALGAAAVPVLASTLVFTYSRGAILAVLVGVVAYLLLARSRGLLTGALAVLPPTAVALLASYGADGFALGGGSEALRVEQGRDVAIVIGLCCLAALVVRLAADRWVDPRLHAAALPPRARVPARVAATTVALVLCLGLPLALGAPTYVERSFDRFLTGTTTPETDQRERLLNPGNNGRLDSWTVAIETWQAHPLLGTGAGTFATQWTQAREIGLDQQDAHSLYVEVLSDLGLAGLVTLMIAMLTVAGVVLARALRRRGPPGGDRSLNAAVAAVCVAWALHAGIDWMWEMPAVTAWVFALAGIALASSARGAELAGPSRSVRVAFGLGCLVLAVIPWQVARSQAGLDRAVRAFRAAPQDCPAAIDASLASLGALGARAEPWELIAYCDVGAGKPRLAVRAARNAIARDPDNWIYAYALSLVQGVAGEDPRPAARRALRLNPRNPLAQEAAERFEAGSRRSWPGIASGLELPLG